ncbi:hypothetical protein CYMTET_33954, partial [Cymbomonas tetramitiformis]
MGKPSTEGDSQGHTSGPVDNAPPASSDSHSTGFSGSSRSNGKGESRGRRGRGSKGSGARGPGGRSRASDAAETETETAESFARGEDAPANAPPAGQERKGRKGGRGGALPADQQHAHGKGGRGGALPADQQHAHGKGGRGGALPADQQHAHGKGGRGGALPADQQHAHGKGGRGRGSHVKGGESGGPAKGRGKDGCRHSAGTRDRGGDHRHRRDGGDSARWRRADVIPPTSGPPNPAEAAPVSDDAHCIVCCNPLTIAAFMSCGHSQVCAECCLRSRMLFKDRKCPLCKADQPEVLLAAVDSAGRPAGYAGSAAALQGRASYLQLMKLPERSEHNGGFWAKQWDESWEAYLLVAPDEAALGRSNQLERSDAAAAAASGAALRQITSVACGLCAEQGLPCPQLSTMRDLQQHAQRVHKRLMCPLCRESRCVFSHEQELFVAMDLKSHMTQHPECQFCKQRFYDNDSLYGHMSREHFHCYVCEQAGTPHQYFQDYENLQGHFEQAHHACQEPECLIRRFVVFLTDEELRTHHLERHTGRMPRWQQGRGRRLDAQMQVGSSMIEERRRLHQAERRQQTRPPTEEEFPTLAGSGGSRPEGPGGGDGDNGLRIIDDDLGREREAEESRTGVRQSTPVQRPDAAAEAFPALPASAAPRTYWGPGMRSAQPNAGGGEGATGGEAQHPPGPSNALEQVQVQCGCGRRTRRVQAPAVGEEAPRPLECDDECARHRRREQLAAAFGVVDSSAVASEQAAQAFTPELLAMASRNVKWVEQVEGAFTDLIGSTAKRASLPAMPKAERGLVHDLAKHYHLATHSYGNEPKRHIDIFRVANSLIPPLRLSQVAKMQASTLQTALKQQHPLPGGMGLDGVMLAAPQWRLQFSEVAPHVEVNRVLWEFQ